MAISIRRFHVGPGITLFLRHRTWWADIHLHGTRWKRNLHTPDHQEALKRVVQIAGAPGTERRVLWTEASKAYFAEYSPLYHAPQTDLAPSNWTSRKVSVGCPIKE